VAERETLEGEGSGRPVVSGLLALVGVALVVGLVIGLTALVGTRMLGLGDETATAETTSDQSMYLPKPEKTTASSGPLITLAPDPSGDGSAKPSGSETKKKKEKKEQEEEISLSASQTSVASMEQIDLTGVYPGGEGAVLQVQRFTSGSWSDFPVTVSVSDETFATYVQSSQGGVNRFRVIDTDSDLVSNEVRVTIG
jgi:hypothetical protein